MTARTPPAAGPPTGLRHPRLMVTASCGCVAIIIGLTAGALAVLPPIAADLGATQSEVQWIGDSFPLIVAALLLPAGALLDRYGRRRGMLLGLVILVAALTWTALSESVGMVIAGRCLAGVGAALVFPGTLATITALLPEEQRRTAVALWAFSLVIGAISGLLLCSAITQAASWQAAFAVLAGIVLVLVVLTAFAVPETREGDGVALDPVGALLSILAVGGLTLAVTEAPIHGWTSTGTLGAALLGVVLLVLFVLWERRRANPLLDVRLLAEPRFGSASAALFVMFFAHFGLVFLAFQYETYVLGYDTFTAALGIVPPCVGFLLTPFSPRLAHRFGRRRVIVVGLLLGAAGCAIAALMAGDGAQGATYWTFAAGATVVWCGMGLAMAPPTELIIEAVPAARQGVASAVNDLTRELGAAFGIAVTGSVFNSAYRGDVGERLAEVPRGLAVAVRDSPAAALQAVGGTADGARTVAIVRDGVVLGWRWSFAVLAAVMLAGAAGVAAAARARRAVVDRADAPAGATAPVAQRP